MNVITSTMDKLVQGGISYTNLLTSTLIKHMQCIVSSLFKRVPSGSFCLLDQLGERKENGEIHRRIK